MNLRKALNWLKHSGKPKGLTEPVPEQSSEIYDVVDKAMHLTPGTAEETAKREGGIVVEKKGEDQVVVFQKGGLIKRGDMPAWCTPLETAHGVPVAIVNHDGPHRMHFEPFPPEPEHASEFRELANKIAKQFGDAADAVNKVAKAMHDVTSALEFGTSVHLMIERSFDRYSRRVYNRHHHPNTRVARGRKRFNGRMVRLDLRSGY